MRRFFSFFTEIDERQFRQAIAVLLAGVTTLILVGVFLHSDATTRAARAERDTGRYAAEAMRRRVGGGARAQYDYNTAYRSWAELDLLASAAAGREDVLAGQRYAEVRDSLVPFSPLLSKPYLDEATGAADRARYEADSYLVEVTVLEEKSLAALAVKEVWEGRAATCIVHVVLLAVSLFLLGLAATTSGPAARWLLGGVGVALAGLVVVWAVLALLQPVPDLRERKGAIEAYAAGVGLAHQGRYIEAVRSFNTALQIAPNYGNALAARAEAHLALGNLEAAAADLKQARAGGNTSASLAGKLARTYYLLGRFAEAIEMDRAALAADPEALWLRFDLGLALLVSGQTEAGRAEYAAAMEQAAQYVAAAQAAGREAPAEVGWWLDRGAAGDLDDLLRLLEGGAGRLPRERIAYPEAVRGTAQELLAQLKSLAVALEYSGRPPQGSLTARIGPLQFGQPIYDEVSELVGVTPADTFTAATQVVAVQFDYAGMQDGQEVLFKVYRNGQEMPAWRLTYTWDLGSSGTARWLLPPGASEGFLEAGRYQVELYVGYHLAQRGSFTIRGP